MGSILDDVASLVSSILPEYAVVLRHMHRTVRVSKPTAIISLTDESLRPLTLGYTHIYSEQTVRVMLVRSSAGEGVLSAVSKVRSDASRLTESLRVNPWIGTGMLAYVESVEHGETLVMPGYVVAELMLRIHRLMPVERIP
ncbi:MAG: hypothetical protein QXX25_09030 [Thermofilaceae archaeon]